MTIKTILLLPHAEHRERLLAPGAPVWIAADSWNQEPAEFGWTVAPHTKTVDDDDDPDESDPRPRLRVAWPSIGVCGSVASALHLVLARDGAVVPEGVDRLVRTERALVETPWFTSDLERDLRRLLSGEVPPTHPDLAALFPLGTLILPDANGEEVSGG